MRGDETSSGVTRYLGIDYGTKRIGLAVAPIQGHHQLSPEPLPKGVPAAEAFQF